eukprot:300722-Karenia_brevis.AAC.1
MDIRYASERISGFQKRRSASRAHSVKVVPFGLTVADHFKLGCSSESPLDAPLQISKDLMFA